MRRVFLYLNIIIGIEHDDRSSSVPFGAKPLHESPTELLPMGPREKVQRQLGDIWGREKMSAISCIVYGTASNTNLRQLDSIHKSGLRLALGAFCTSPVSSLYTEVNEAPLEERWLKLSMHYYVKTRACIDNPAHQALHEFEWTNRDLYAPRPNGRGDMTRPPAPPIGLKVEEAMTSAEINAELVCPLRTPNFPPGTHDYKSVSWSTKDHMMKPTLMTPKWTTEWG